ncbi:MAG: hypothetical protein WD875_17545 [Pirellulales bacterium]
MKANYVSMVALAVALIVPSRAMAYLGSFGPNDGYYAQYGTFLGDVTYYNAGQSGINAGGGPTMQIVADSGLWTLQSPVGGVFPSAALRAPYIATAPPYALTDPNGVPAYLLGGHFSGRNNDGYNLAFRNDTPIGTGPAIYEYAIDTFDTGGPVPASVTSGVNSVGFYFCPNPADVPDPSGQAHHKFTLSVKDSLGNIGLEWGYARDNEVTWRDSPSSPWTYTGVYANSTNWDGIDIDVDLTADTFGIDYYDVSANTWSTMVPAGTPLGMPLLNITTLRWQLEDGVATGTGGKNYFDDFSIQTPVPEPSSIALVALTGLALLPRLRRKFAAR